MAHGGLPEWGSVLVEAFPGAREGRGAGSQERLPAARAVGASKRVRNGPLRRSAWVGRDGHATKHIGDHATWRPHPEVKDR
jgi:hypothetical protein